ncbi:unnamed protein product [Ilex paraguariensis]|uniref:Uncharacterized protein n=1 Tax=Ilex paraguariensis TaxID=185542 RepID=A0ABC8TEA4_9AQUA
MESYNEARAENHSCKASKLEERCRNQLDEKRAELHKTKQELKRAKDDAMQSWLDSRPLIDELEKLQSGLASEQNRSTTSNVVILELESQLKTTNMSIRSRKEIELKVRTMITQLNQYLDETRQEMEQIKQKTDEERRARSKLRQVLRLRRQTLGTLQLTLGAVQLESEAFGASTAEALRYTISQMENNPVQLTQEDYSALTRRAKEETSLADWRVSVAMEQKLSAQESRKLKEVNSSNRSTKNKMKGLMNGDGNSAKGEEEGSRTSKGAQINTGHAFPKARAIPPAEASKRNPRQLRGSKTTNKKILLKRKKPSIFVQIRSFLVRKITRLFA